ncbi:hypothetical protein I7I48_02844 [Histoplasma ohiense]|nr:hypothetical protein I7I48_02844 [Histoplasma ohiense (nom. inval.)]
MATISLGPFSFTMSLQFGARLIGLGFPRIWDDHRRSRKLVSKSLLLPRAADKILGSKDQLHFLR